MSAQDTIYIALLEHTPGCVGHHCTECGCCLLYDPNDPDMKFLTDESPAEMAVCGDCNPKPRWKEP